MNLRLRRALMALLLAGTTALAGVTSAGAHHVSPQTGEVRLQGNLAPALDGTRTVQATVKDALGGAHTLTITFERPVHVAPANDWLWRVTTDDPAITTPSPLASGHLAFPLRGGRAQTDPRRPEGVMALAFANGAPPADVNLQLDALTSLSRASSLRASAVPVPHRPPRPVPGAVTVRHDAYAPRVFTARAGQPVTWVNHDYVAHTVTSQTGLFDGQLAARFDGPQVQVMPQPNTFAFTFVQPGTYTYACTIHPAMRGTVRVTPAR